eukprot:m.310955 g.310955  ORF g.310955 m.310955 type:complete len:1298 (+) comp57069_c0_seq1:123-4016(+)
METELPSVAALTGAATANDGNDEELDGAVENERRLSVIFSNCDREKKGYLCPEDFTALVGSDSDVEAKALFDQLDGDRDGRVTWEDFKGRWESAITQEMPTTSSPGHHVVDHVDHPSLLWSSDSDENDNVFSSHQEQEVKPKYVMSGKRFGRRSRPDISSITIPGSPPRSKPRLQLGLDSPDLAQQMAGVKATTALSIFGLENMGQQSPLIQKRTFKPKFDRRDSPFVAETGDYTSSSLPEPPFETSDYSIKSQSPNKDEMEMIEKVFKKFDDDRDGLIDRADFSQVCASLAMTTKEEEVESLFDQLDEDKDGRVSVSDFSKGLTVVKETYALESKVLSPTGDHSDFSYSSPMLVPRMSTPSARASSLMSKKTAVEDLFHQLDTDQRGLVSRDSLISVWLDQATDPHNEQHQQITRFLQELDTDEFGYVSMEEVTFGLQALLMDDHSPGVQETVLRIYLSGIRHLRARLTNVVLERDNIQRDLVRLSEQKARLVREGDEEVEHVRREHRRKLEESEQRWSERAQQLERERREERESLMVQVQKQVKAVEEKLESAKGQEDLLKEKLKEAEMRYQMLEDELNEQLDDNKSLRREYNQLHRQLEERELERSTTDLDRVLADYEDDNHKQDMLEQVQDLQREISDLRDQLDERQAEISSYKQQILHERRKAGKRRKSSGGVGSGSLKRTGSKVSDYVRRRKESGSAEEPDGKERNREPSSDDGIGSTPTEMEAGEGDEAYVDTDDDEDAEAKVAKFAERIKELEREKWAWSEDKERLEGKIRGLEMVVSRTSDETDDGVGAQKQIKALVIEREELRSQVNHLEEDLRCARDEESALLSRINDMEGDFREWKMKVTVLEEEKVQAILQTESEVDERKRLEGEIENLKGDFSRVRKESATEVTAMRGTVEGVRTERARDRLALEMKVTGLRSEMTALETERDDLHVENASLTEKIHDLKERQDVLVKDRDEIVGERDALMAEKTALVREKERLLEDGALMGKTATATEERVRELEVRWRGEVELVKAELAERETSLLGEVNELSSARDALNDSVLELSERNKASAEKTSELESQLEGMKQTMEGHEGEAVGLLQARLTELETKKTSVVQDRDRLEEEVANLQDELSSSLQEVEFWQSQAKMFEETIDEKEKSLKEKEESVNTTTVEAEEEIRALQQEASRLTELVEEKDGQVVALEICLGRYSAESTEQRLMLESEHKRWMAAMLHENESLHDSLLSGSRVKENRRIDGEVEALEIQNSALVNALETAEKKERELTANCHALYEEKQALVKLVRQITIAALR